MDAGFFVVAGVYPEWERGHMRMEWEKGETDYPT
jgi:hypothetical protein